VDGKKRGSGFGTTLVLALVVVILSVALAVGINRSDFLADIPGLKWILDEKPDRTTSGTLVVGGIQDLNKLATVRRRDYVFIDRESGGNRLQQIFDGETVRLLAVGEVEAGVNLANVGGDDVQVNEKTKTVTIDLPKSEILDVSLDEDETRVYDREFSPLNFRPDDDLAEETRDVAVSRLQAAAEQDDILKQAENNAESSIRSFVTALGFKEVRFAG